MALTFADLVIVAALVAAGCVVVYVSLQRALRRTAHELHQSTEDRLGKLTSAISAVEKQIAQPSLAPVVLPAATVVVPTTKTEAQAPVSKETAHSSERKNGGGYSRNIGRDCGSSDGVSGQEGSYSFSKNAAVAVRDCESVVPAGARVRASFP